MLYTVYIHISGHISATHSKHIALVQLKLRPLCSYNSSTALYVRIPGLFCQILVWGWSSF